MTFQSENERNKAVVDEYFKAGVQAYFEPQAVLEKLGIKHCLGR